MKKSFLVAGAPLLLVSIFGLAGICWWSLRDATVAVPLASDFLPYSSGNGARLCGALADRMQLTSSHWSVGSWVVGFLATVLVAAGGIVGPGDRSANGWRKGAGVLLATVGGLCASSSAFMVSRSTAAATASGSATLAIATAASNDSDGDRLAFRNCLFAKSQWLQSRTDSLAQLPPANTSKVEHLGLVGTEVRARLITQSSVPRDEELSVATVE